ncbi:MAG: metal-dependent transcriptional regulator [Bacteroidales bacterium]|nr:metal-dependent transcriptional regulator [Bacteroidales bacterium]
MSVSIENFLKTAYLIRFDENQKVLSSKLALRLNITNAAVTDMAKKLSRKKLVNYQPYHEIELTEKGEKTAIGIIRRHRLWELFLSKVLNLNNAEIHEEAENLEHQTSDFLMDKIDEFLEYPNVDPHGDPIPDRDGNFPPNDTSILLSRSQNGKEYKISRVNYRTPELIDFFKENEFKQNVNIRVLNFLNTDNSVVVLINNIKMVLSRYISDNIYVKELNA